MRGSLGAQLHLTLAFCGEVTDPGPVARSLDEVLPGRWAPSLRLAGGGTFRGGVLWLGLEGDLADLSALAQDVQKAAGAAGVEGEGRLWHPHVTVGRSRTRAVTPPSLASYLGPVGTWSQVSLVRSHLGRGGARHEPLRSWHLGLS